MIERLDDNTIFVNGEIHHPEDFPDGVPEQIVEEYDEAIVDGIISNIHPREEPKRHALGHVGVTQANIHAEQKPVHERAETMSSHIAEEIIRQYEEEAARLRKYKHQPDFSRLRRNVWIAIIRNYQALSEADRYHIEQAAGLTEQDGESVPPHMSHEASESEPEEERDWRERQFKDN